ncbi:MAG TPA: CoA-binding protein [Flavobacteriales bacterium]|nr:CoA-binding protein [Flavobacteriales bacterium]HMR27225.1 CoA-binding protein [Flavobacteriales bacterium]
MAGLTTLVLGASARPDRYSNIAVRRLLSHGHPVVAVGARAGHIGDEPVRTDIPDGLRCHTVTLYLNAHNQQVWYDRLLALAPQRIIFNPGAENRRLADEARRRGIEVVEGCTLVMLAAGTY